jgi:hypothetical protein
VVNNTGVTTGPWGYTYFNPPADGDGTFGNNITTGSGVCLVVNGTAQPCQAGGNYGHSNNGGEVYPPPVHPAVDPFVRQTVNNVYWLYPWTSFCNWAMYQGYTMVDVAQMCVTGIAYRMVIDPVMGLL